MAMKVFEVDFGKIGKQEFLRSNIKYRYFFDVQDAVVYKSKKQIKLKHVLKEITSKKLKKGELEKEEILVDISNIERKANSLINLESVNKIGSDKNILEKGDIIIPKIQLVIMQYATLLYPCKIL